MSNKCPREKHPSSEPSEIPWVPIQSNGRLESTQGSRGVTIQSNGRLESTQGSRGGGCLNPVQWEAWILHSGIKDCVRKKTIHRGGKDRLGSVASKAARNSSSEHLGFSPSSSIHGFYSSLCCGLAPCLGGDTAAFSSDPMNERMAAEG